MGSFVGRAESFTENNSVPNVLTIDLVLQHLKLPACWQIALFPELLQISMLSASLIRVLESFFNSARSYMECH